MKLKDGERRIMRPVAHMSYLMRRRVMVTAHCVDSDAPFVLLNFPQCKVEVALEDHVVTELIVLLARALSVLPSSK